MKHLTEAIVRIAPSRSKVRKRPNQYIWSWYLTSTLAPVKGPWLRVTHKASHKGTALLDRTDPLPGRCVFTRIFRHTVLLEEDVSYALTS